MLAVRDTDEDAAGSLAQQAIQCYTQNEIAGAAQATGRDPRKRLARRKVVEGGVAGREAFEDDGLRAVFVQIGKAGGDRRFARTGAGARDEGEDSTGIVRRTVRVTVHSSCPACPVRRRAA